MYKLAIIGGGPAGYSAAAKAIKNNLSVVLFEQKAIGGVCLNEGCIPTKTLLFSAKQYYNAKNAEKYGVSAENVKYDWNKIQQRKTKTIRKLQAGIRQKLKSDLCEIVTGQAIVKNYRPDLIQIEANGQIYESENLLVCTGSKNFVPPIEGIDSEYVIDSTQALNIQDVPQNIIIVGGGVIGMEFATLFHELGSKVSVVEAMPKILANVDDDISNCLQVKYMKEGVVFYTDTKVAKIQGNKVICNNEQGEVVLEGDKILVCVGRRPNTEGLDALNLRYEGRGVWINEQCQTSLPNVYAAGDVTGTIMLAHVAVRQAEVAVGNILKPNSGKMTYFDIPSVVYSNPEIAMIGSMPKDDCDVDIRQIPMTYSGRFVAENEGEMGLCKIAYLTHIDNTIIGAQMIGNSSSEIISSLSYAIHERIPAYRLESIVFPHPTVSEIIKENIDSKLNTQSEGGCCI